MDTRVRLGWIEAPAEAGRAATPRGGLIIGNGMAQGDGRRGAARAEGRRAPRAHAPLRGRACSPPGRRHDPLRAGPGRRSGARPRRPAARAVACGSAPTASALAQALARDQFARAARAPVAADRSGRAGGGHARATLPRSRRLGAPRRAAGRRLRSGGRDAFGTGAAPWSSAPATAAPTAGAGSRRWRAACRCSTRSPGTSWGRRRPRRARPCRARRGRAGRAAAQGAGPAQGFREFSMPGGHAAVSNAEEGTSRT